MKFSIPIYPANTYPSWRVTLLYWLPMLVLIVLAR